MLQLDWNAPVVTTQARCPIFICLFGGFALLQEGRGVAVACRGKAEVLLTTLALRRDQGVSRDTLLAVLWPNHTPDLANQSLNSLVYSLRKQFSAKLGGAALVQHNEGHYGLNLAAGVGIDLAWFEALVRQGNALAHTGNLPAAVAAYHEAVALYRGDLWGGTDVYAAVERERLRAAFLTVLAWLADYYYAASDYAACLDHARRLLAHDPCREDAHRLLMRCYVRHGQRAQALRQYHFCVEILRAEFDTLPEAGTTALYERIRSDPDGI